MDIDRAMAMLALLLGGRWSHHSAFHHFLEQSHYKVLNKDQWCNILEFSRAIHPDLSNYDEDGACKSLILAPHPHPTPLCSKYFIMVTE